MNYPSRWRIGALASAVALLSSLTSFDAMALGLGRITVQSALGESLKAEIDITEISADEASSLKADVASPETFARVGLEYTAAVNGLQVSLQRRADGRAFLRLTSNKAVTEPFVDLVVEASWSSGRMVRDYTMLFDPPNLRQRSNTVAPTVPSFPSSSTPTAVAPSSPPELVSAPAEAASNSTRIKATPPPTPADTTLQKPSSSIGGPQLIVKSGDTAGKIAAQSKPTGISLDQMLVALLQKNPNAFTGANVNRLKAGAVLEIPSEDAAAALSAGEASRMVLAQAKDFNAFRRKLADNVSSVPVESASRQAGGKVQAKVQDHAAATAAADKLTLSKGAVQGQSTAAAEDKIAKSREAKATSDRVAELSKNISDLNKLTATPTPSPAVTTSAAKGVGLPVSTPSMLPASAPVVTTASAPAPLLAPASAPATVLSAPAAPVGVTSSPVNAVSAAPPSTAAAPVTAVVKKPAIPAAAPPEPSLIATLTDNPFMLPGVATILLLAGFGFYRYKKKTNTTAQVDSSFLESRLQPDSFFGASGGGRIDTNEGGVTGSSLVYSPSQLDAAGDVDPVAEADVYLAYGRDLQAEEILKEALRTTPTRLGIHSKLTEIYAKRRDAKAFEVVAIEAFNLTRGDGPEWAYIAEMGHELDPSNQLYERGGRPQSGPRGDGAHSDAAAFGSDTIPLVRAVQPEESDSADTVDLDLDLDFSVNSAPPPPIAPAPLPARPPVAPTPAVKAVETPDYTGFSPTISFDAAFSTSSAAKPKPGPVSAAQNKDKPASLASSSSANALNFSLDTPQTAPVTPSQRATVAEPDNGMLEFDMGSLSLDLVSPDSESPASSSFTDVGGDPLATKLALAQEFQALGDVDGARSLAEEVASQASGALQTKAQAFLKSLS